jgi:hypothetical protein
VRWARGEARRGTGDIFLAKSLHQRNSNDNLVEQRWKLEDSAEL